MAQYRLHRLRTPGMHVVGAQHGGGAVDAFATPALPTPADIDRESAISPYLERLCFKSKTAWCGVVKHSCGGASQRAGKYLGQKSRKVELSPFLLPTILDPLIGKFVAGVSPIFSLQFFAMHLLPILSKFCSKSCSITVNCATYFIRQT